MQLIKRIRDTFLALLPIMAVVLIIHLFFYKIETDILIKFFISVLFVCIGEALLLTGIDSTIMPMGELMVGSVNKASKFFIFIFFAVIFGFCATIAEPDISILTEQITGLGIHVNKGLFVFFVGAGVGLFIALGIARLVRAIELKYVYVVMFAIVFLLATQVKSEYIAIAFDAGGATVGIVTAPFLLAVASGISSKVSKSNEKKETFGLIGIASVGPILSVLLFFICFGSKIENGTISTEQVNIFLSVLKNVSLAIIPLLLVFFVYDILLLKLPMKRKFSLLIGTGITFVGLYLFLFGIDFGISKIGTVIGNFVATLSPGLIIFLSVILGFIITFTEPSVVVLSKQVSVSTKGNISSVLVMISIAISMSAAIALSALKILFNLNFFYIILIGYLIALILMFFVPGFFTGLAFDSGGVASGPMTSAFVLPIMIALASNTSSSLNGFGLIGIVGMCPIVVLQLLGLAYQFKIIRKTRMEQRKLLHVSYGVNMYSNIEKLEEEYRLLMEKKKNENK